MLLTLETIITLPEHQVSHDVVRQPIAPLAYISWGAPSFVASLHFCLYFLLWYVAHGPSALRSNQSNKLPSIAHNENLGLLKRRVGKCMAQDSTSSSMLLLVNFSVCSRGSRSRIQREVELGFADIDRA